MNINQVAAQMYTLRDHCKTPAELSTTLKKVRAMGYQAIQLSGIGPMENSELAAIMRDQGLVCCATHEKAETILDNPQACVDKLKLLDCQFTAYPYPSGIALDSLEQALQFCKKLDKAGKIFADNGQTLCYHNHDIEFIRFNGRLLLEMIFEETDARHLQGEPDVFWIQAGGHDPAAWCKKLSNRLPLIHLKDYGIVNQAQRRVPKEVGFGNLDFNAIISAAEKAGCRWFIVEQDSDWHNNDPFLSLKMSFDYIKENLCA